MPTRSPEGEKLINSLPVKEADYYCNARTERGYCHNRAGAKTNHKGKGRCHLHGGRAGRPIVNGLYSKKMKTELREEYEKISNDSELIELKSELGVYKTLLSKFIERFKNDLDDPASDFWTTTNSKGDRVLSPEAKALNDMLKQMTNMFKAVVETEKRKEEHLDLDDIYNIITQIRNIMDDNCSRCPVRSEVGKKLSKIKIPHK